MVVYFLAMGPKCHSPPKLDVDLVLVVILIFLCCWLSSTIARIGIMVYPTNSIFHSWLSHGCVTYVNNTSMSPSVPNSILLSKWTLDMEKDFFVLWSCPFPMLVSIAFPLSTSPLDAGGNFIEKKLHKPFICLQLIPRPISTHHGSISILIGHNIFQGWLGGP